LSSGSSELDVEGVDTELLASEDDVLSGKHSSVRGRLISVSLDLHTSCDSREGFTTGEIGDVLL
jgi:hypothetical protein